MTDMAWKTWDAPSGRGVGGGDGLMWHWQSGRCALCDDRDELVLDHCHVEHLTRGFLCRSCNVREGKTPNIEPFVSWRLGENPATAYGWRERMWGATETVEAWYESQRTKPLDVIKRHGAEAAGRIG